MAVDPKRQLEALVPEIDEAEVERALRSTKLHDRRQRLALAAAMGVIVAAGVLGAFVVAEKDGGRDVTAREPVARSAGSGPWPWTTSTTSHAPSERPVEDVHSEVSTLADAHPELVRGVHLGQARDGRQVVEVDLRADAVDLAAEIWDRFGSAVLINVGYRVFPTGSVSEHATACPEAPAAGSITGLEADLELEGGGTVPSGGDIDGVVKLRNTTDEDIEVDNPTSGTLVVGGGVDVVGVTTQAFGRARLATTIPPGETVELPVVIGTTTCATEGPPGVEPGTYDAIVSVRLSEGDGQLESNGSVEQRPEAATLRAPVSVVALDTEDG